MLSSVLLNNLRQHELVNFTRMFPGRKVTSLKVIPSVSHNHFKTNSYHLRIVKNYSAIIKSSLMKDGASHVNYDTVGDSRHYQILDDVPGVENGVVLQKVIFT